MQRIKQIGYCVLFGITLSGCATTSNGQASGSMADWGRILQGSASLLQPSQAPFTGAAPMRPVYNGPCLDTQLNCANPQGRGPQ